MRGRLLAGLAAALVLLAGCGGVPDSGPVHVSRADALAGSVDDPDSRILPPGPTPGMSPEAVVRGFVNAIASPEHSYGIARQFLAPAAAKSWHPGGGVTVYNEQSLATDLHGSVVTVTVDQSGSIDSRGGFEISSGLLSFPFPVQKVGKEWRIAQPPSQLLLSAADVRRSYRSVDIYFLDPTGQVLVPDRVYLQSARGDVGTEMVRRLLGGPSPWLAPAVQTAFPKGTRLADPVQLHNGVASVDLTDQAQVTSSAQRRAMSAQLVWTLKQLTDMSRLEITSGGTPLTVQGQRSPQSRDDWSSFDPDVLDSSPGVYYSRHGSVRVPVDGSDAGKILRAVRGVSLRHPTVISGRLAALGDLDSGPAGVGLYSGSVGGALKQVLRAADLTAPTFDVRGRLWTVATDADGRQRVVVVPVNGAPEVINGAALFAAGPVQSLRPSRDGTRVAAVVGEPGARKLLIGRVAESSSGLSVGGFRQVLSRRYVDVADVSWLDARRVAALVKTNDTSSSAGRFPLVVGVDGWPGLSAQVLTAGLPPEEPTQIAAAPGGHQLAVSVGGQIWGLSSGVWRPLAAGQDPAFGPSLP